MCPPLIESRLAQLPDNFNPLAVHTINRANGSPKLLPSGDSARIIPYSRFENGNMARADIRTIDTNIPVSGGHDNLETVNLEVSGVNLAVELYRPGSTLHTVCEITLYWL